MKLSINWRLLILLVGALALVNPMAQAADHKSDDGSSDARSAASDDDDSSGKQKPPKGHFTRLSGQVTNNLTGEGLGGVVVLVGEYSLVTDANGYYSQKKLPVGDYDVTVEQEYFEPFATSITLIKKGRKKVLNIPLEPIAPVVVEVSITGDALPGASLTASASYKILDGSTFVSSGWEQTESVDVIITEPGENTTGVKLPAVDVYKEELIHILMEPPISNEELPPNVEPPPGEFVGGLQDRYQVVGINHWALERAGHVALEFAVTTSSGEYSDEADIHTVLPWRVNPGLRNVPINAPVLLHAQSDTSYDWSLSVPGGSALTDLTDPLSQNPQFTPDVAGMYTVTENVSGEVLEIYAGTWRGIIVGQNADGLPVVDPACAGCHSTTAADWSMTGHAERFTTQLNGAFYSPSCFGCHTVGFDTDPAAVNDGFDDVGDYAGFLVSGLLGPNNPELCPDGDWACMLADFPDNAQRANIQCENCHGPQIGSGAHTGDTFVKNGSRFSLSSDVCASCHGEPLRHARFQQWQLSRHSNYELAIEEGGSGNCSRCHTGNGFLTWLPILTGDAPGDPLDNITVSWTADETHPQTCVTCHDPHNAGNISGDNTNAPMRVEGDTPLLIAGFQALDVGKGAMCMTCHNTRRGLRNDSIDWSTVTDKDRAPHGGVQADTLMGQNAYFVAVGTPGLHTPANGRPPDDPRALPDTCVDCHMRKTDPPADLAYNLSGANHTFFASDQVCIECHESDRLDFVRTQIGGLLDELKGLIIGYYTGVINDALAGDCTIDLDGDGVISQGDAWELVEIATSRGRQALVFDLGGGTVGPKRLTTIGIAGGCTANGTSLFDQSTETVLKSTWNHLLVVTDRSGGVHNRQFASNLLDGAINAMAFP